MKDMPFQVPVVASLAATPVCLGIALLCAGAGHGTYFPAIILFPYTMLSTMAFASITAPFILLAVAQFPLYGLALGIAGKNGRFPAAAVALSAVHLAAAILFLLFRNWSNF